MGTASLIMAKAARRSWRSSLMAHVVRSALTAGALVITTLLPVAAEPTSARGTEPVSAKNFCRPLDAHGRPFVACFDPGNRVLLDVSTDGLGGALLLRHEIETDEADATWRLEHEILSARTDGNRVRGALYTGRYLRHARDGRIVLPPWPQRKLFVPFDLGAEAELGRIDVGVADGLDEVIEIGALRAALLVELTRSPHVRRRLAIGAVADWDVAVLRPERRVIEHRVAPLSRGLIDGYLESRDGLTQVGARIEAGTTWSNVAGWSPDVSAEARIERIVLALNDQPLSVYAHGRYRGQSGDWQGRWDGTVGLRFAFMLAPPDIGN